MEPFLDPKTYIKHASFGFLELGSYFTYCCGLGSQQGGAGRGTLNQGFGGVSRTGNGVFEHIHTLQKFGVYGPSMGVGRDLSQASGFPKTGWGMAGWRSKDLFEGVGAWSLLKG